MPFKKAVNPARAGMILRSTWNSDAPRSKPRASGDDPPGRARQEALRRVNPARAGMIRSG